ncbi:unnamed protein product [Polarella glacialis]|uniref:Uncharacterized protein n=1 Tax=Polarella glacialis TaxID=89957 RepID=A0A813FHD8_POLGL|nr:unnamed protein product [Polarella glacialis]
MWLQAAPKGAAQEDRTPAIPARPAMGSHPIHSSRLVTPNMVRVAVSSSVPARFDSFTVPIMVANPGAQVQRAVTPGMHQRHFAVETPPSTPGLRMWAYPGTQGAYPAVQSRHLPVARYG